MIRTVIVRALAVALASLAVSVAVGCRPEPNAAEAADGPRYVLGIEGMSCAVSCPPAVKTSLEGIEGVKKVEISFEEKRAVVQMAADRQLTKAACDKSFGNKGYFVSSFAREDAAATTATDPAVAN